MQTAKQAKISTLLLLLAEKPETISRVDKAIQLAIGVGKFYTEFPTIQLPTTYRNNLVQYLEANGYSVGVNHDGEGVPIGIWISWEVV